MNSNEIKGHLTIVGCRLVDIADELSVAEQLIGRVMRREATSDRVQRAIAARLNKPVEDVFPDRYQARKISPRREEKRQRLAS
ncbi:MAG: helix-turn-helix domain-containing protein [Desulfuromonadales bacterium]|nr:helix-turn-helix domain-containing protein [Desulfuromonadales bacterium]